MGVTIPNFNSAYDFLQTLKIEYFQQNGSSILADTQGTQQLFYATVEQKNQPWLNQGLADPALTGLIVRSPLTPAVNNPTGDPTRDRLTGLPLDEKGRYTVQVAVGEPIGGYKTYSPQYFPCATSTCIATGKNLDSSDPGTQAYLKALDAQVFKDINTGATLATIVSPVGVVGGIAAVVGPLTSISAGFVEGVSGAVAAKELLQFAVAQYLTKVYGLADVIALRVTAVVDLAGGWQAFIDRSLEAARSGKQ